jgi:acyl-coenzyme A thioesterase PaaI-like protein
MKVSSEREGTSNSIRSSKMKMERLLFWLTESIRQGLFSRRAILMSWRGGRKKINQSNFCIFTLTFLRPLDRKDKINTLKPEALTEFWYSLIPFVKRTKMEVLEIDVNYVKMKLPHKPNSNYHDNVYGSSLLAVIEIAGAGALLSYYGQTSTLFQKYYIIIAEFNIKFRCKPKSDMFVSASIPEDLLEKIPQEAAKYKKYKFQIQMEVVDEVTDLVAIATVTYQLREL